MLRRICTILGIKGYKNKKKEDVLAIIGAFKENDSAYDTILGENSKSARIQMQGLFRLLNVVFSDKFAERFCNMGSTATSEELDTGCGSAESLWCEVCADFLDVTISKIGKLQFDHQVLENLGLDLTHIVQHD